MILCFSKPKVFFSLVDLGEFCEKKYSIWIVCAVSVSTVYIYMKLSNCIRCANNSLSHWYQSHLLLIVIQFNKQFSFCFHRREKKRRHFYEMHICQSINSIGFYPRKDQDSRNPFSAVKNVLQFWLILRSNFSFRSFSVQNHSNVVFLTCKMYLRMIQ